MIAPGARRALREGGRWEWAAVGALVLVSAGLRTWAALAVPVPWIAPDEIVYGLLGQSLFRHGSLAILGGPTPFYSFLTPAFVGLPLSLSDLALGYDLLRGLQPLAMSLAAVPVYAWGRSLVSRRAALAAAALTLATPGLTYAGLVMTEVLFYPLLVLSAWAAARAIERPTPRTQALLVVAVAAAAATRLQAIVLLPAFATAALVDAGLARSARNLRRLLPAAAGLAALTLAWVGWRLASGEGTLGGYEVVASTSYSAGEAARYVLYHLASVLVLSGFFPACALALLLVVGFRRREDDPAVRAYVAVASSLLVWLVVEVGVFASRYSDRIVERNLLGLAPVLFLGLLLWLERGPSGGPVVRGSVALGATLVLVVLPVERFVNVYGTHDAMTMIPLYRLAEATSLDTLTHVFPAVAGAAAVVFALVPRQRLRRLLPVFLLVVLVAASVSSSRFVAAEARAQQARFLGPDPRWIDHAADGRVAYLYDGEPDWNGVWETLFWNRRIDRVSDLGEAHVPGPLPQKPVAVEPGGTVVGGGGLRAPAYVVASTWITLVGEQVARIDQEGLSQAGLGLWRIDPPLRVATRTEGLKVNGDVYANTRARLTVYGCDGGTFRLTLLIKESETVDVRLDGRLVERFRFPAPAADEVWRGEVPAEPTRPGGTCTLELAPSGLLGTTVFAYEPSG